MEIHTEEEDDEEQLSIAEINPLRYRGYYYDNETGYYYLQSRYYDPELCRFISADSFDYIDADTPMSVNAYAYCENNPINFSDSTGHDFTWDTLFDILKKCLIIDFVFPEFRYKPKITLPKVSTKKNNVSKWVSDEGKVIGVVITEIFTCLDLQAIADAFKIDFTFSDFADYLQKKADLYKKAFDEGIPGILPSALKNASETAGKISALLGFFEFLPNKLTNAVSGSSYILNILNDTSGRYLSPTGSIFMTSLDILINLLFDASSLLISKHSNQIIGNLFNIAFQKYYDSLGTRNTAEFLAYNWYYLMFVDWRKV